MTANRFQVCDKCERTFPPIYGQCNYCNSPLRLVELEEECNSESLGAKDPRFAFPKPGDTYNGYIQNFWVNVQNGLCHVDVLSTETGARTHTFQITKRYDRAALTELLLAASMDFNADYVSTDYVFNLVTNAIDSIWYGMRQAGIRKLRPKIIQKPRRRAAT